MSSASSARSASSACAPSSTPCASGRHLSHDVYSAQCPCRGILDLLANKWSALILGALEDGPLRFGTVQRRLQGISPKVLTASLRRLEDAGFLDRTVYPAVPLHVEYDLTDLGRSAAVPLGLLRTWVEDHMDEIDPGDALQTADPFQDADPLQAAGALPQ